MSRPERVAVATLLFEANTFCPEPTTVADFYITEGAEIFEKLRGSNTEIWGFIDVLQAAGVEVVPGIDARAASGGTVARDAYEELKQRVLKSLLEPKDIDAVLLCLHGAMAAEGADDAEGLLLEELRAELPKGVPLVVSMDHHANVTERKFRHADVIVGYDTYPHIDMGDTGRRAARVLLRMLRDGLKPATAFAKLPLIVPPENEQTTHGPMAEILATAKEIESQPRGVSASVFAAQPWMDIDEMGGSVITVADDDFELARQIATRTAQLFWEKRAEFTPELLSPAAAIRRARAVDGGPVVFGESSDGIGSGSPGDSNEILKALLAEAPELPSAVYVVDPEAAREAVAAGVGAALSLAVGGKIDTQSHSPVKMEAHVERVYDAGGYTFTGPCMTGVRMEMGKTAVLRSGEVRALVSERKALCHDQEIYRSAGIDPESMKILVAKSPNMFRAVFGPIAKEIIMVDTPGVSSSHLVSMPYDRISRPIYPLDTDGKCELRVLTKLA